MRPQPHHEPLRGVLGVVSSRKLLLLLLLHMPSARVVRCVVLGGTMPPERAVRAVSLSSDGFNSLLERRKNHGTVPSHDHDHEWTTPEAATAYDVSLPHPLLTFARLARPPGHMFPPIFAYTLEQQTTPNVDNNTTYVSTESWGDITSLRLSHTHLVSPRIDRQTALFFKVIPA